SAVIAGQGDHEARPPRAIGARTGRWSGAGWQPQEAGEATTSGPMDAVPRQRGGVQHDSFLREPTAGAEGTRSSWGASTTGHSAIIGGDRLQPEPDIGHRPRFW